MGQLVTAFAIPWHTRQEDSEEGGALAFEVKALLPMSWLTAECFLSESSRSLFAFDLDHIVKRSTGMNCDEIQ